MQYKLTRRNSCPQNVVWARQDESKPWRIEAYFVVFGVACTYVECEAGDDYYSILGEEFNTNSKNLSI